MPAHRDTSEDDRSTRDALMDAALEQLRSKGVLAGLNLREVADDVGVTPANIYYYFGTRQGLLRATLSRELERVLAPTIEASPTSFLERRLHMFDAITASPEVALTALLALDHDPEYQPMPFIDGTRAFYAGRVAAGELPPELDVEAVHLLGLATSIGIAIYAEAAARQLGQDPDELRARTRAVFATAMAAMTTASAASPTGSPASDAPEM